MAVPSNFFAPLLPPAAEQLPLDPFAPRRRLPELPPLGLIPAPIPAPIAAPQPSPEQSPPAEPSPGILSTLGHQAMSGLATVGNLLDVPGSMVRDALAWENPLDQLLTPFSGENRTSGRELLTKWGATAPNDPDKWEAADFL